MTRPAAGSPSPTTDALEGHLAPQADRSRDFFWHRLRWRAVRRYVPTNRPLELVDVGAGAGLLGDYLAAERPAISYRYVEPIASLQELLEERFGAASNAAGEERYAGADLVTLLDVLEHQENDNRFLLELAEKMDRGSRLILTVPALPTLWSAWDEALGHYKRYTRGTLEAATSGAPFRRIEMTYLFPEMLPAALLRRKRRPPGSAGGGMQGEDTFPDLSPWTNTILNGVGTMTQSVRFLLPVGTSLFAVYERR